MTLDPAEEDRVLLAQWQASPGARPFQVTLSDNTASTVTPVPNTPGTPRRTVRITGELWDAAQATAAERNENLSEVIRKALERYVRRYGK